MHFDNIQTTNKYLPVILSIVRDGIARKKSVLQAKSREGLNTQTLVETFNILGTTNSENVPWIGVQKEHERANTLGREDIYFHLNDDDHTRVFYIEAKRLPKYRTKDDEEYVIGAENLDKKSGGIQRYKSLNHGVYEINYNGMIAFVENRNIDEWVASINTKLKNCYPEDTPLVPNEFENEFTSSHLYLDDKDKSFTMHHFWINVKNKEK